MDKTWIIFFDGHCLICDKAVLFIKNRDPDHKFLVALLSGETAKIILPVDLQNNPHSLVLYNKNTKQIYIASTAALKILKELGQPWSWIFYFIYFPKILRDPIYYFVSRIRYLLFKRKDFCTIPSENQKKWFLP